MNKRWIHGMAVLLPVAVALMAILNRQESANPTAHHTLPPTTTKSMLPLPSEVTAPAAQQKRLSALAPFHEAEKSVPQRSQMPSAPTPSPATATKQNHSPVRLSPQQLALLFGDDRDAAIEAAYAKGEYDPAYDQSWPYDMEQAAYDELTRSALRDKAIVASYQCTETACQLKLDLFPEVRPTGKDLQDYLLNLKSQPAILKSGKKRNVLLSGFNLAGPNPSVNIYIGEVGKE